MSERRCAMCGKPIDTASATEENCQSCRSVVALYAGRPTCAEIAPVGEMRERVIQAAYTALRNYRMGNMGEAHDPSYPYPLVDLCSRPGGDISDGEEQIGEMAADVADAILSLPLDSRGDVVETMPRLTDAMIQAACDAHYGKGHNIDGLDLTANDYNWSFRQGFQRMWTGIRKQQSAIRKLGEKVDG